MKRVFFTILLILLSTNIARSAQLLYMYSTDFKKDSDDPYKYHYSNAFDNEEKTLWCFEHSPGGREEIVLYFPKTVEIRKVSIKSGTNPKVNKDVSAGGVKEIELIGEFSKNVIYIDEGLLSKTLSLSPPIATNRLVIAITDVYNKESDLICIRDIQLSGVPDNLVSTSSNKLFRQKTEESQYWGKWQGGTTEGAYEKFLFLGMEGNYLFIYTPFDPDLKGMKANGTYKIKENDLLINYKNEQIKGRIERTDAPNPKIIFEDDRFKGSFYFEP